MPKPIQRPKVHHLKDVYQDFVSKMLEANPEWWGKFDKKLKIKNCFIYAKEDGKVVLKMSWLIWKNVLESYFHKAKYAIIQGETLKLGAGLGLIRPIRVERSFKRPQVNWGATFKQAPLPDGTYKKIYYTNEDYCRIQWLKFGGIPNETSYSFDPAARNVATGKGFKAEFAQTLQKNPMLKYKYTFYPIVKNKPCSTHLSQLEELLET